MLLLSDKKRNITNKYLGWNSEQKTFFHSGDVDVIVTQQDCVSILLICIAKGHIYSQNSSTKSKSSPETGSLRLVLLCK